jgi:hypothetical protein
VGKNVVIGGQAGFGERCELGNGAVIGGQSGVLGGKTIRGGQTVWGTPDHTDPDLVPPGATSCGRDRRCDVSRGHRVVQVSDAELRKLPRPGDPGPPVHKQHPQTLGQEVSPGRALLAGDLENKGPGGRPSRSNRLDPEVPKSNIAPGLGDRGGVGEVAPRRDDQSDRRFRRGATER